MTITVVGLGYVGLVTAACLSKWGYVVRGVDANPARIDALRKGMLPIFEPGLAELVQAGRDAGLLSFDSSVPEAVADSDMIFIAVGTHDGNGGWQTDTVRTCLAQVVPEMHEDAVLVIRSTLPPDFVIEIEPLVRGLRAEVGARPISVLLNPEFTREGNAIADFTEPERVVVGVVDDPTYHAGHRLRDLYAPADAPVLMMSGINAALAKLGSNLFLATKISFANELAAMCDAFGGTVDEVVDAMARDRRIGRSFMGAGVGFGGSCLPNQVAMMVRTTRRAGVETPLLEAVEAVNHGQRRRFAETMASLLDGGVAGKRIALLGLTFKPNTDDLRDAPALEIARLLIEAGAEVTATDPMPTARARAQELLPAMHVVAHADDAVAGADAIGLVTEWPEYQALDWAALRQRVRGAIVLDGRNCLVPGDVRSAGFRYFGIGRGAGLVARDNVPARLAPAEGRTDAGAEVVQ